ncbi:L-threonylcarbamoyladenylate synthase [Halomonas organivorans]|uniref:Threonylcarbamoyl-AMP synthase n=1 Tax=Halomonas organivorans TaxID=257772 RepID=A0A7W5BVN5_9GAMM|nr:Sua5/YciO/YrdC/YwlC family protein [Halomonas organivorans]MBB3139493.1 L-threonylcarbamoyladenylate synthase [Halomonas organivorans]
MTQDTALATAVAALRAGGVIAYPTEAVWGLGCDPDDASALTRLLALKRRDPAKGVILVAADIDQLAPWLTGLDAGRRATLATPCDTPTTWLVPDNGRALPLVRGEHDRVALRISTHPRVVELCRAFGGPIVSTSANRAGEPSAMSAEEIHAVFGEGAGGELDAVLDGPLGGHDRPSTIRDLVTGRVLRD